MDEKKYHGNRKPDNGCYRREGIKPTNVRSENFHVTQFLKY